MPASTRKRKSVDRTTTRSRTPKRKATRSSDRVTRSQSKDRTKSQQRSKSRGSGDSAKKSKSARRASPGRRSSRRVAALPELKETKQEHMYDDVSNDYVDSGLFDKQNEEPEQVVSSNDDFPKHDDLDQQEHAEEEQLPSVDVVDGTPKHHKKSKIDKTFWGFVLVLLFCLDIPLCRVHYHTIITNTIKRNKQQFLESTVGMTKEPCTQLIDFEFPKKGDSGYSEYCDVKCKKAVELSGGRDEARNTARMYHPIGNIAGQLFSLLFCGGVKPTPSCDSAFESVDKTNETADMLCAGLTMIMCFGVLNYVYLHKESTHKKPVTLALNACSFLILAYNIYTIQDPVSATFNTAIVMGCSGLMSLPCLGLFF